MPNPRQLVPGSFFTPEQWQGPLYPFIERLADLPGGVLIISVEIDPNTRNYPDVRYGVFDRDERAALKRAITNVRKKKEAK